MATVKEDYVSFETAALLKEKGFDSPCMGRYSVRSREFHLDCTKMCNNGGFFEYAAPSQSMAMKWLREVYGLFISIGNDDLDYNWQIFDVKNRTEVLDPICLTDSYGGYRKYELACELALKYCLENLI